MVLVMYWIYLTIGAYTRCLLTLLISKKILDIYVLDISYNNKGIYMVPISPFGIFSGRY
jgi:hypothetical protein